MRIMKKITAIILTVVATATTALAATAIVTDNDTPITFNELPEAAKEFVHKHFGKEQVSHVTLDNDIIDKEYTLVFASGTKLEFNGDGDWKEVDCRYTEMPQGLVPEQIENYIKNNYPNSKIREIKREHGGWEVKITGGLELTFNRDFKLVDIDD
ncbi:MAG: hypothetical protein E7146_05755 [Rikenellaceae bacterium]|nr:hypothetical protein [Rikenellaceae bacterium]